jgi:hypothetical protein
MYPSGSWRGYWEQAGWGRQPMRELVLRFADGAVEGEGVDCIGRFTFAGEYGRDGSVTLVKQYVGRHRVLYRGSYDGEGTIFGRWSIGEHWSGPFALSPDRSLRPADLPVVTVSARPPSPGGGDEEMRGRLLRPRLKEQALP